MGFLSKLFSGTDTDGNGKKRIYLIDGSSFGGNGSRSKLSPGDQIQLLRRLARVSGVEQLHIIAVFDGEPLRKIDDGEDFENIRVYFANGAKNLPDLMNKLIKEHRNRRDVMVVTGNVKLEEQVRKDGIKTFRASTFKKAFDGGGGREREQKSGGRSARGGNRRGGNRSARSGGGEQREKGERGERPPRKQPPKKSDPVGELLDLVD